jgi:phage terminase small subunit
MTARQLRFIEEYLVDMNATQAAIRAGYSPKTANREGPRLLSNAGIAEAIAEGRARLTAKTHVTREWVIERLAQIAGISPRQLMTWGADDVTLRPSADLTDAEAYAVAEVASTATKDGVSLKLKNHDKVRALELLGKHLGLFIEKHQHDVRGQLTLETVRELIAAGRGGGRGTGG